eukprot:7928204-Pyramimonas_sp.AAC.1
MSSAGEPSVSPKINQVLPSEAAGQSKDFSSLIGRGGVLGVKLVSAGLQAGSSGPYKSERSSGRMWFLGPQGPHSKAFYSKGVRMIR